MKINGDKQLGQFLKRAMATSLISVFVLNITLIDSLCAQEKVPAKNNKVCLAAYSSEQLVKSESSIANIISQKNQMMGMTMSSGTSPVPVVSPTQTATTSPVLKTTSSPVPATSPTPSVSPNVMASPTPITSPTPVASPTPVISPTPVTSPTPVISPTPNPTPTVPGGPSIKDDYDYDASGRVTAHYHKEYDAMGNLTRSATETFWPGTTTLKTAEEILYQNNKPTSDTRSAYNANGVKTSYAKETYNLITGLASVSEFWSYDDSGRLVRYKRYEFDFQHNITFDKDETYDPATGAVVNMTSDRYMAGKKTWYSHSEIDPTTGTSIYREDTYYPNGIDTKTLHQITNRKDGSYDDLYEEFDVNQKTTYQTETYTTQSNKIWKEIHYNGGVITVLDGKVWVLGGALVSKEHIEYFTGGKISLWETIAYNPNGTIKQRNLKVYYADGTTLKHEESQNYDLTGALVSSSVTDRYSNGALQAIRNEGYHNGVKDSYCYANYDANGAATYHVEMQTSYYTDGSLNSDCYKEFNSSGVVTFKRSQWYYHNEVYVYREEAFYSNGTPKSYYNVYTTKSADGSKSVQTTTITYGTNGHILTEDDLAVGYSPAGVQNYYQRNTYGAEKIQLTSETRKYTSDGKQLIFSNSIQFDSQGKKIAESTATNTPAGKPLTTQSIQYNSNGAVKSEKDETWTYYSGTTQLFCYLYEEYGQANLLLKRNRTNYYENGQISSIHQEAYYANGSVQLISDKTYSMDGKSTGEWSQSVDTAGNTTYINKNYKNGVLIQDFLTRQDANKKCLYQLRKEYYDNGALATYREFSYPSPTQSVDSFRAYDISGAQSMEIVTITNYRADGKIASSLRVERGSTIVIQKAQAVTYTNDASGHMTNCTIDDYGVGMVLLKRTTYDLVYSGDIEIKRTMTEYGSDLKPWVRVEDDNVNRISTITHWIYAYKADGSFTVTIDTQKIPF